MCNLYFRQDIDFFLLLQSWFTCDNLYTLDLIQHTQVLCEFGHSVVRAAYFSCDSFYHII